MLNIAHQYKYITDPHGAVGILGLKKYFSENKTATKSYGQTSIQQNLLKLSKIAFNDYFFAKPTCWRGIKNEKCTADGSWFRKIKKLFVGKKISNINLIAYPFIYQKPLDR